MHSTAFFSTATFFLCVATVLTSPGAVAFKALYKTDDFECFSQDDGLLACLQEDYPDRGFSTVFFECPETASSVLECERCEIFLKDEGTPNEIDFANKSLCTSCTVCHETVAFDCSNLGDGDCASRDCQGVCTAISLESIFNDKPRVSDGLYVVRQEQECLDVLGWHDSLGNDCDFYDQGFYCQIIGWGFEKNGYTAKEACCHCGGGNTGDEGNDHEPSTEPTGPPTLASPEPTTPPTAAPSTEPTTQPTPESSNEPTIPSTPESSPELTIPPTAAPSAESTIPPTSESSNESMIPSTPDSSSEPPTSTPEPSSESTIPPTLEPSSESLTIPPTPEPTNPPSWPSTPRPTFPNEPPAFDPLDFSVQRFRANGIKIACNNMKPLGAVSSLRWQDITGRYMAVAMKAIIGSKLVESVEVSVSLTFQDPPFVSGRALLDKKLSTLRRLQTVEELTFDVDISIEANVDASAMSHYIKKILNKDEYLAALKESGDNSFANVDSISVTSTTFVTRLEDPADNDKPRTTLIAGLVAASIATMGLVAFFFLVRRRTNEMPQVTSVAKGDDSSTIVSNIYIEDVNKASFSKSSFPTWLSGRLGSTRESSLDSSSETPFAAPTSDVDEESLFVSSLIDRRTHARGDADEESIGEVTLSSITSDFSYPASNWSLAPAPVTDELMVSSSHCSKDDDASVTEFEVRAPAGALGVVLVTPYGGVPRVHHIDSTSPLAGRARVGDWLVAVDGTSVTLYTATAVSRLIESKKDNDVRNFIFARQQ